MLKTSRRKNMIAMISQEGKAAGWHTHKENSKAGSIVWREIQDNRFHPFELYKLGDRYCRSTYAVYATGAQ